MRLITGALAKWLPLGVAVTMLAVVAYAVGQQVYRQSANDPQVMIAEDLAARLGQDGNAAALVSRDVVDPSRSLDRFVMVFDAKGALKASNVALGGTPPVPPAGILQASLATGENRVTWQPRSDARIASVVVPVPSGGGFVLAGRSLRVVEERVDDLGRLALAGWAGTMLATFAAVLFLRWLKIRTEKRLPAEAGVEP